MRIVTAINEWQLIRKELTSKKIGFVPTMGHLHAGHMSLCQQSLKDNDMTVVSIFVNPTQFNNADDFANYPNTIEADKTILAKFNIDYLFLPTPDMLYPDGYQVRVMENELSQLLEGQYRPGHFDGVLTIVLKLFQLIQPNNAYFGEKDYQQLLLIKKMVASLFLPIKIIACETLRAEDGLALSSRNSRLTSEQRQKAAIFPRLLASPLNIEAITKELEVEGFKVDYIAEKWQRRLGAVWLDTIRLIDNVKLETKA